MRSLLGLLLTATALSRLPSAASLSMPRFPPARGHRMSTVDEMEAVEAELAIPYFMEAARAEETGCDGDDLARAELLRGDVSSTHNNNNNNNKNNQTKSLPPLLQKVLDKVGKIDESRIISSPQYLTGEEPKLFSNLIYQTVTSPCPEEDADCSSTTFIVARPSRSAFLSSSALLCGTALGSGLSFLPSAVSQAGYLPTSLAALVAWGYTTVSALLTAELLINRCGETGRARNVGLLELYKEYLGPVWGKAATVGFVSVSYVVMGVYFQEGGDFVKSLLDVSRVGSLGLPAEALSSLPASSTTDILQSSFVTTTIFASLTGIFLATASKFGAVQRVVTHVLVPSTLLAFAYAATVALPTADFRSLVDASNQHPECVLNAFPLLFMSWTYHGVVPRVVYNLEGDKNKITKAIVGGSTSALVVYLIWNAVILGNVLGDAGSVASVADGVDPIRLLRDTPQLTTSVAVVSLLAVTTSLIGVILGFVNEFYDAIGALPSQSFGPKDDNKWQVALLTLVPSAVLSILLGYYNPDMDRYQIMEYTGAFGASTLFLILPALMVWQNRYGDDARPLTVKPMFPLGKITLGSLYKAAGTLIVEQGLEKLGVFEFIQEHLLRSGDL